MLARLHCRARAEGIAKVPQRKFINSRTAFDRHEMTICIQHIAQGSTCQVL